MPLGFISDQEIRARLEELGVTQVRLLLSTGGLPTTWQPNIVRWLAEKDQAEQQKKDALQVAQHKTDESVKKAAWAAVYIGGAAIIVALLVWILPHLWG
jgi:hypothetical protein